MTDPVMTKIDGNEAAACVVHPTNEVIAIHPITPASPTGAWAHEWSSPGIPTVGGAMPEVIEKQSEGGAAGAVCETGSSGLDYVLALGG